MPSPIFSAPNPVVTKSKTLKWLQPGEDDSPVEPARDHVIVGREHHWGTARL